MTVTGTNQGDRQASVRAATGTTWTYEGDWHALFTQAGVASGDFNGRLLAWINTRLGTTYSEINGAMYAFAVNQGFTSWGAMGTFDASGVPAAPVNTVAPAIYGANYYTGTTLTADRGLWTGSPAPAYTYQWKRGGSNISSATNSTYVLVSADEGTTITVTVTATNSTSPFTASATSAGIAALALPAAPANTVAPTLSSGSANVGTAITCSPGTWTGSPTPTFTYQWFWADTVTAIGGATSSTYTPVSGDVGHTLLCNVTGTNSTSPFTASASTSATGAVTSTPAMPSGALGIWYAKDYDSAKRAVPNAATGASLVDVVTRYNVEGPPVNEDVEGQEWSGGGNTMVSTTGPLGGTILARRVTAAGDFYVPFERTLAAGTYTLAFDVKSNTGSSVQFQSGRDGGGAMVQKTATTSWQRMAISMVSASTITPYLAMSFDRATGADLLFSYVSIFNGASDLGRQSGANLFIGSSGATVSNPSTGVIDMTSIGGIVSLDTPATPVTAFTGGIMVKRKVNSGFTYQPAFSAMEGFSKLAAFIEQGQNAIVSQLNGGSFALSGVWDTYGQGWHLLTYRWDGSFFDIFLDASRVAHVSLSSLTAFSMRTLLFNCMKGAATFTTNHYVNSWFYYDSALTTSQIQTAVYPALAARLIADGQTHTQSRINSAEGDSITNNASSYYALSAGNLTGQGVNYSVPGSTLANLVTRFTSAGVGSIPVAGSKHIISVLIGANDLGGYTGATDAIAAANYTTDLFAYYDSLRGAGWRVLACTVLPTSSSGFNARRAIVNANLRAAIGVHCDGVADFDTDAQMGIDASFATYPANWTDSIHPNATGHARLVPIYYAAANAL